MSAGLGKLLVFWVIGAALGLAWIVLGHVFRLSEWDIAWWAGSLSSAPLSLWATFRMTGDRP